MTRMATAGMEIIGMTTKARNAVIHRHHIMENLIFSGREGRGGGLDLSYLSAEGYSHRSYRRIWRK